MSDAEKFFDISDGRIESIEFDRGTYRRGIWVEMCIRDTTGQCLTLRAMWSAVEEISRALKEHLTQIGSDWDYNK